MIYSNEIVFGGHPDKVCDQISDALLDAYLEEDKNSRCGIEVVFIFTNYFYVSVILIFFFYYSWFF